MIRPALPAERSRSSDHLVVVGLSHDRAPLAVRERVVLDPGGLAACYRGLGPVAAEALVLSTCARTEIVALVAKPCGVGSVERLLQPAGGAELPLHRHSGLAAARYVARIAAGLDSPILGEPEILGQVQAAADRARQAGMLGPVLGQLVIAAVRAGRRARAETAIARGATSLGAAAVAVAEQTLGSLRGRRVVLVGAGSVAVSLARCLTSRGAHLTIVNRTESRARELAATTGAAVRSWHQLGPALENPDLIIAATAARRPVVTVDSLGSTERQRPLLILDLGAPRNVEPELDGGAIRIIDLDAIRLHCDRASQDRRAAIAAADEIVAEEVRRFDQWRRRLRVVPTISALKARAAAIRDREVARALGQVPPDGDLEETLKILANRLVDQILDGPIRRLATDPEGPALASAATRLFHLDAGPPS
jgi:glutamyl-tRNA reductase